MPNLRVINGNNGNDGTPPRQFREHPLAIYLWEAIHPHPANNYAEIAERMSANYGSEITFWQVNNLIHHVRKNADNYGWTIPHVKKGAKAVDETRKYFRVLHDPSQHPLRLANFRECARDGTQSSAKTLATMAENQAIALEFLSQEPNLSVTDKRKLRGASALFSGAVEIINQVMGNIATV